MKTQSEDFNVNISLNKIVDHSRIKRCSCHSLWSNWSQFVILFNKRVNYWMLLEIDYCWWREFNNSFCAFLDSRIFSRSVEKDINIDWERDCKNVLDLSVLQLVCIRMLSREILSREINMKISISELCSKKLKSSCSTI